MFGDLCFMVSRHMCCGIIGDKLLARVGAEKYDENLKREHAYTMDFTGKPMKGMLYVAPEVLQSDENLEEWIETYLNFIQTLPPKKSLLLFSVNC